jgi:hypothetical protein
MIEMLILALLGAAFRQSTGPEPQQQPFTYISYVSSFEGKCTYMTGDVLFDEAQFKHDLKNRFDPEHNNLVIYHAADVAPSCLGKAREIARKAGFLEVTDEIAPPHLSMGPP